MQFGSGPAQDCRGDLMSADWLHYRGSFEGSKPSSVPHGSRKHSGPPKGANMKFLSQCVFVSGNLFLIAHSTVFSISDKVLIVPCLLYLVAFMLRDYSD